MKYTSVQTQISPSLSSVSCSCFRLHLHHSQYNESNIDLNVFSHPEKDNGLNSGDKTKFGFPFNFPIGVRADELDPAIANSNAATR